MKMKYYFIIQIITILIAGIASNAYSQYDVLRHYTPTSPDKVYSGYPIQIARFEPVSSGYIHAFVIRVQGDSATTADVLLYGHEGGDMLPALYQALCDTMHIVKTTDSVEDVLIYTPAPVRTLNNQFFLLIRNMSGNLLPVSDSVVYSGFCLAGSAGGDFYWQYLKSSTGSVTYRTSAFKIDAIIDYDSIVSPPNFQDVTPASGIIYSQYSFRMVSVADFDNDGDEDVLQGGSLLQNQNGVFANITQTCGLNDAGTVYSNAFADMDNDGVLDIILVCADSLFIYRNNGQGYFQKNYAAKSTKPQGYKGTQTLCVADVNNDRYPDLFIGRLWVTYPNALSNFLYLNNQNLGLQDATQLLYTSSAQNLKRTRGSCFADFDNDGDMDLYVTNYYLEKDEFFQNNGDGTFSNIISQKAMDVNNTGANHGTGGVWGDYDNDGDLDFLLPQFAHPQYATQYDHRGTTLYRNEGPPDFSFTDLIGSPTLDDDIQFEESHAGANFGDVNNDGLLDFFITAFYSCRYSDLYIQQPDHSFELKTRDWLPSIKNKTSEDVLFFDYNNDGKLDAMTGLGNTSWALLYKNNSPDTNHFVKINLRSNYVNSHAIGGRATVFAGGQQFTREVMIGHGANVRDPYTLHFGLGSATSIDSVLVKWPFSPSVYDTYYNLDVDTSYTLYQQTPPDLSGVTYHNSNEFISVYPNPAGSYLVLEGELPVSSSLQWKILDMTGRLRSEGSFLVEANVRFRHSIEEIDALETKGMYILSVTNADGFSFNKRIIIGF